MISYQRLFRWDVDYGDEQPKVGDAIELESGLTIRIDALEDKTITASTILYMNVRSGVPLAILFSQS